MASRPRPPIQGIVLRRRSYDADAPTRFRVANVLFALAGIFALMYTLPPFTAYSIGASVGTFFLAFFLRAVYVKILRRRAYLPLFSGWILVLALLIAFISVTSGSGTDSPPTA